MSEEMEVFYKIWSVCFVVVYIVGVYFAVRGNQSE